MLILISIAVLVVGVLLFRTGMKILGAIFSLLGLVLVAACVVVVLVGETYRIPSESMEPTVDVDDRVLAVDVGDPGIGDIVILHPPAGAEQDNQCGAPVEPGSLCERPTPRRSSVTFIKRVVARGGDTVAIRDGLVIRNGKPLDEPYAQRCKDTACQFPDETTVPKGHLFVLGDNRGASDDSRFWGPVPEDWVLGRVVARYWPLKDAGSL